MQPDLVEPFKQAMRRLATTISLVTSGTGSDWTGMAATAVTSVTAAPPTMLVAANLSASIVPILERERAFCINILADRHRDLVATFSGAKKGLERFDTGDWHASAEGLPILTDAAASLVCSVRSTFDVGTHRMIVGEVTSAVNHPTISPLIWVDGGYASAARI